jgi:hypothetical protein
MDFITPMTEAELAILPESDVQQGKHHSDSCSPQAGFRE